MVFFSLRFDSRDGYTRREAFHLAGWHVHNMGQIDRQRKHRAFVDRHRDLMAPPRLEIAAKVSYTIPNLEH